ncbi:MAG: YlmC/YmxH family sporulation protein [Bacilli bacterium]
MRLSDLQTKEIINMSTGKRLGLIIDVIIDNNGHIKSLILEDRKGKRFTGREEYELDWKQIAKIGDDIILIKDKYQDDKVK